MLGCLGVSGWCLGGVWGCVDGVWIVSKCAEQLRGAGTCHFRNRPFIKIPYNKGCFEVSAGCLWGVCGVSRWCLGESGYCLGGRNTKSIENNPMTTVLSRYFIFSQLPIFSQRMCILRCLEGVCGVSVGCLEGARGLLDYVLGILMPNQLQKVL